MQGAFDWFCVSDVEAVIQADSDRDSAEQCGIDMVLSTEADT